MCDKKPDVRTEDRADIGAHQSRRKRGSGQGGERATGGRHRVVELTGIPESPTGERIGGGRASAAGQDGEVQGIPESESHFYPPSAEGQ